MNVNYFLSSFSMPDKFLLHQRSYSTIFSFNSFPFLEKIFLSIKNFSGQISISNVNYLLFVSFLMSDKFLLHRFSRLIPSPSSRKYSRIKNFSGSRFRRERVLLNVNYLLSTASFSMTNFYSIDAPIPASFQPPLRDFLA